ASGQPTIVVRRWMSRASACRVVPSAARTCWQPSISTYASTGSLGRSTANPKSRRLHAPACGRVRAASTRGSAWPAWRGPRCAGGAGRRRVGKQTRWPADPPGLRAHLSPPSAQPDPLPQLELFGSWLIGPASTEQADDPRLQHLGGRFGGGELAGDRRVGEQPVVVHALVGGAVEGALRGGPGRIGRHLARVGCAGEGLTDRVRVRAPRHAPPAGVGASAGALGAAEGPACLPWPGGPRPQRRRSSSRGGWWRGGPRWPGWTAGGSRASGARRGWPAAPR